MHEVLLPGDEKKKHPPLFIAENIQDLVETRIEQLNLVEPHRLPGRTEALFYWLFPSEGENPRNDGPIPDGPIPMPKRWSVGHQNWHTTCLVFLNQIHHTPAADPQDRIHLGGLFKTSTENMIVSDESGQIEVSPLKNAGMTGHRKKYLPHPTVFEYDENDWIRQKVENDPIWAFTYNEFYKRLGPLPASYAFNKSQWNRFRSSVWEHSAYILAQYSCNLKDQIADRYWLLDLLKPNALDKSSVLSQNS